MSESGTTLRARVRRAAALPWAYAVPLLAAALAAWFVYRALPEEGPVIRLLAADAEGLDTQATTVRYRGTVIGEVTGLTLSGALDSVVIEITLRAGMEPFAKAGARFWIVKPELTLQRVSGLRTIVSGRYIAARPGGGEPRAEFEVAARSPLPRVEPGSLRLVLNASLRQGIERGTTVDYRGVPIGVVETVALSDDASYVEATTVVYREYASLVREDSVFWTDSGLDVKIGLLQGLELSASDLRSVLSGGVSMATPDEPGPPAEDGAFFPLRDEPLPEWKQWRPRIEWRTDAAEDTRGPAPD